MEVKFKHGLFLMKFLLEHEYSPATKEISHTNRCIFTRNRVVKRSKIDRKSPVRVCENADCEFHNKGEGLSAKNIIEKVASLDISNNNDRRQPFHRDPSA